MSSRRLGADVDHRHMIWRDRGTMTCGNYIDDEVGWQVTPSCSNLKSSIFVIVSISQLVPQSLSISVIRLTQGGQSWLSVISKFPNRTGKFYHFTQKLYKSRYWSLYALLGPTLVITLYTERKRHVGFKEDFTKCNQHAE